MPPDPVLAALAPLQGPLRVGLSGGLDSTVLLHALVQVHGPARVRAVHVHHGLQTDADEWAEHCQRLCLHAGISLHIARVQVDRSAGIGVEAAARAARHAAFAHALQPGETLVLAHHRDDQAETVLLRLLRGSASGGLAAMADERDFAVGHRLARPLLGLSRADLQAYAQRERLTWCEDPTNADTAPDRNFLRHRVLPLLAGRWPAAGASLARSAALLAEDARLLDEATGDRLRALGGGADWLPVAELCSLDPAWRARVLRQWTAQLGLPPLPGSAPARIGEEVLAASHDRAACFRWSGAELRRWRGRVYALPAQAPPEPWQQAWDGSHVLALPDGSRLELQGAGASLASDFGACRVALRQGGERIRLPGRAHSHALKDRLQSAGIPPWQRQRLPLLWSGQGELLAAGDGIVSAQLESWLDAQGAWLQWRPPGASAD